MSQELLGSGETAARRHPPAVKASFACSWKSEGLDSAWVHVVGELDRATVRKLRLTLADAQRGAKLIVLDLRELTFIDSSGLHLILEAAGEARWQGGHLVVVRPSAEIDRILTLTGLSDEVSIFDLDPGEGFPSAARFD